MPSEEIKSKAAANAMREVLRMLQVRYPTASPKILLTYAHALVDVAAYQVMIDRNDEVMNKNEG